MYGVLSHSAVDPVSSADILFFIDDDSVGTFSMQPDGQPTYTYNYLLYANDSLPHSRHVFSLQNGQVGGPISLILLDYLVYSTSVHNPVPVFFCLN